MTATASAVSIPWLSSAMISWRSLSPGPESGRSTSAATLVATCGRLENDPPAEDVGAAHEVFGAQLEMSRSGDELRSEGHVDEDDVGVEQVGCPRPHHRTVNQPRGQRLRNPSGATQARD
jgi:hypothetical protein